MFWTLQIFQKIYCAYSGEKQLTLEEFLPIYADAKKDKDIGQIDDYIEVLKLYDKEGNGYISANQLTHLLIGYGKNLTFFVMAYHQHALKDDNTSHITFNLYFRLIMVASQEKSWKLMKF